MLQLYDWTAINQNLLKMMSISLIMLAGALKVDTKVVQTQDWYTSPLLVRQDHLSAPPPPPAPPLPTLNIDPTSITISGISSGADFVVNLHVAHSNTIKGVGVFAGQVEDYMYPPSPLSSSFGYLENSDVGYSPPVPYPPLCHHLLMLTCAIPLSASTNIPTFLRPTTVL